MTDIDRSLAFTALLELMPGFRTLTVDESGLLVTELVKAWRGRPVYAVTFWDFARAWTGRLGHLPQAVRCQVPLVHPDHSEAQCTRHMDHVLQDTDHRDEHGHTAPVLVHQSTIREIQAVQDARERGEIE